ncbi:MAG: short-chain dehydrogenase [Alphaproteobacteria bacterium HGW-Alphaproteobacteria-7]|jgi:NAD(P)-dependent dehydrogenase (short-subunit alcohol dehydrogenase family)|nr:MAG: short-chain dehydrogenase [Alphaproteobacteria bacterium HGW-Alphaproteobacteria-7]
MAQQRSIFITGGASGIGRAVALHFSARGWFVGVADVNEAGMAETLSLIAGEAKFAHRLDVRDRAAWDDVLAAFAAAAGGRIDAMINNAGIGTGGALAELSKDEIDACLDINLRGVLYGAQAAYPYLKASAPGSALVNIASAAGLNGGSGMSVYSATKFGVRGIAESLDAEWAPDGIKVSSICPSFIDTPLLDGTGNRNANEDIRTRVKAAGLEITPVEQVAEAVWNAVHGDDLHYLVGKTARQLAFAKRWMPGKVRKQQRAAGRQGLLGK